MRTGDSQGASGLNRPINSKGVKYGSSTLSKSTYTSISRATSTTGYLNSEEYLNLIASQPIIPFPEISNALQLFLKLQLLQEDELTISWVPGSYTVQQDPFVPEPKEPSFLDYIGFGSSNYDLKLTLSSQLFSPGYLLLTNLHIYIFAPRFRLSSLKTPLSDEQTSYCDPSKLIKLKQKISLKDILRIDLGPRRQYLIFRVKQDVDGKRKKNKEKLCSIMFHTRSRNSSTAIIDSITTTVYENEELPPIVINQDTEWCIKNIQSQILLQSGEKSLSILNYNDVWNNSTAPEKYQLKDEEADTGVSEPVTKVDFDFVKMYLLCGFLRYTRPVQDSIIRGIEIQHVSLLGTTEYLYLFQERLDIWPPPIFPTELGPTPQVNSPLISALNMGQKGLKIDVIPEFDNVLGVGRLIDVCRIERWRSYRIDQATRENSSDSAEEFKGLGRALQNGVIGYYSPFQTGTCSQQGTVSGWMHWIRIIFGKHKADAADSDLPISNLEPNKCPDSIPSSSESMEVWYW